MSSNLVIAAIPAKTDRVWEVSSEKIPHLTLLFLGDQVNAANLETIVQFVEHAANTTLSRFYLPVDRRGELGADKADVLFFKTGRYDYKAIRDFRATLLKNDAIKTAYNSATQFEGPWTPHLTLGYPATPAKPVPDLVGSSFYEVAFDTISVWTGDFEGPEFVLKDFWDEYDALESVPMDVAMSNIEHHVILDGFVTEITDVNKIEKSLAQTVELGAKFLAHYGIKGMHWGQRKQGAVTTQAHIDSGILRRQTKIQTTGGEAHPPTRDAITAAVNKQKLKKSGVAALSNQELRELQTRIQLETQVQLLTSSKGKKFVSKQLEEEGKQQFARGLRKNGPVAFKKARKTAATVAVTAALA
jgi:2'-5' RNA ligase